MKEHHYITYRKLKAFCNSLAFYICRVFPIKKNLVSVCTFEGKGGFGCNPKYVVQKLHERNPNLEFVWFVNDMAKEFPNYVKKVPNTLWSRAYWLSRSKVWIDNYRKPYGTVKRKNQFYVNTWHGEYGFKALGLWRGAAFSEMARLVSENDSKMIDLVPIESRWGKNMYPRGLLYDGEFLMSGSPRCDALFGNVEAQRKRFRERHSIPEDSKIIMFAPTYRETAKNGKRSVLSEIWSVDFNRLLKSLSQKFGGNWFLCARLHPQLAALAKSEFDLGVNVIDASMDDDMYEDLAAMDAFLTDYSSAAFDASLLRIPVFIYVDDLYAYKESRGDLQWEMSSDNKRCVKVNNSIVPEIKAILPYSISENNDELEEQIISFDSDVYLSNIMKFENDIGLLFDGKASERVAETIEKFVVER